MATRADESTPLLRPGVREVENSEEDATSFVDPMTLTASRRRLILVGLWLATFLGVSGAFCILCGQSMKSDIDIVNVFRRH